MSANLFLDVIMWSSSWEYLITNTAVMDTDDIIVSVPLSDLNIYIWVISCLAMTWLFLKIIYEYMHVLVSSL